MFYLRLGFFFAVVINVWSWGLNPVMAQPHDELKYPVVDEVVKQEITPPTASRSIDEHLLKLAKAGNINIIADATAITADEKVEAFPASQAARFNKWPSSFHLTLLDLTQEKRLAQTRFDDKTFLFWAEPEKERIVKLAQKIVREFPRGGVEEYPIVMELSRFLVEEKLLPQAAALKLDQILEISPHDLTPFQQTRIERIAKELFAARNSVVFAGFDDKFWQEAAVRLQTVREGDKTVRALQVGGFYDGRVVRFTLPGLGR